MCFVLGLCFVVQYLFSIYCLSSFEKISLGKRELVTLLFKIVFLMSWGCWCSVSLLHGLVACADPEKVTGGIGEHYF